MTGMEGILDGDRNIARNGVVAMTRNQGLARVPRHSFCL